MIRPTDNKTTVLAAFTVAALALFWDGTSAQGAGRDFESQPFAGASLSELDQRRFTSPASPHPAEAFHMPGMVEAEDSDPDPEPETRFVSLNRRSDWLSPGHAPNLHDAIHRAACIRNTRLLLFAPKVSPPA